MVASEFPNIYLNVVLQIKESKKSVYVVEVNIVKYLLLFPRSHQRFDSIQRNTYIIR